MKREIVVEEDSIIIDGFEIEGLFVGMYCRNCGSELIHYEQYDSEFCPQCNEWISGICGDGTCIYCKDRPAKPLPE